MKENLVFYQHLAEADRHPKFKMLRIKYGWEGEGKFWALNNRIALADFGWLNISKKYNKASIASDLDFNKEEFEEYITYLIEECELIFWDGKKEFITTDTVQENLKRTMVDREASRLRKKGKTLPKKVSSPEKGKSSPEPPISSPDQTNKPNQTKPKETKLNNNQYSNIFKCITHAIVQVDGFFKKNNQIFDARNWAVGQFRNCGHPGAILKTFEDILAAKFFIENPCGLANHIMKKENGNYNEADAIGIHKKMKKLKPSELSHFTNGLFEEF